MDIMDIIDQLSAERAGLRTDLEALVDIPPIPLTHPLPHGQTARDFITTTIDRDRLDVFCDLLRLGATTIPGGCEIDDKEVKRLCFRIMFEYSGDIKINVFFGQNTAWESQTCNKDTVMDELKKIQVGVREFFNSAENARVINRTHGDVFNEDRGTLGDQLGYLDQNLYLTNKFRGRVALATYTSDRISFDIAKVCGYLGRYDRVETLKVEKDGVVIRYDPVRNTYFVGTRELYHPKSAAEYLEAILEESRQ